MQADDPLPPAQAVTGHVTHLTDDQLVEICFAAADSSHVEVCQHCRLRYDRLTQALDALHDDAVSEADAVFSTERLSEQRSRVLQRLERSGHAADVVRFPIRPRREYVSRRAPGRATRWIAAAAVAGLVAGLFLGRFVTPGPRTPYTVRSSVAAVAPPVTDPPAKTLTEPADEEILGQIDDALISRRVHELRALDALTSPEFREVSFEAP